MIIRNKIFTLIFRIVLFTVCGFGIVNHIAANPYNNFETMLWFYTTQSNILCFILSGVVLYMTTRSFKKENADHSKYYYLIKSSITLAIIVTGLIYHFLLSPSILFDINSPHMLYDIANLIVHYFTPIMIFLDWLLFDPHGKIKLYYPLVWTVIPLIYASIAFIRAHFGEPIFKSTSGNLYSYPYFFLDIDTIGLNRVCLWIGVLLIIFIIIGYILLGVDLMINRYLENKSARVNF